MEWFYVILAIVIVVLMYLINMQKTKKANTNLNSLENLPYKAKPVLTINEYEFYKELKIFAEENQLIICPKVNLKDIFDVKDNKYFMAYFNKINKKHIDFLICNKELKTKYVIELDDKSHEKEKRKENDNFKNALFKQAGIPLIRVKALQQYTKEYVISAIDFTNE